VAVDRINAIAGGSPPAGMRVGIEAALRVHDDDLKRLTIPYDLLQLRDLVCGYPKPHDLIMVAANHSGYSDSATAVAAKEDALLAADRKVLARVGEAHDLFLDIYSVNPAIRILGEAQGSGPLPAQCGEEIPFGEMVMSRDYPVMGDGTLALFWNGTVATPTFLAPPGDYEFRWRARGTKAKGRFPSLKATVLDAQGAAGTVTAPPRTFDLTGRLEPFALRFHVEKEAEILLRIDFDDDAYEPSRREDRNVYLAPISLLPIAPQASQPVPPTSGPGPTASR